MLLESLETNLMKVWPVHNLCKAYGGYRQFQKMFYLVPKRRYQDGLILVNKDEDVLAMCKTSLVDPNEDVHIYFNRVIDVMREILICGVLCLMLLMRQ